jgi:hypothetical protein
MFLPSASRSVMVDALIALFSIRISCLAPCYAQLRDGVICSHGNGIHEGTQQKRPSFFAHGPFARAATVGSGFRAWCASEDCRRQESDRGDRRSRVWPSCGLNVYLGESTPKPSPSALGDQQSDRLPRSPCRDLTMVSWWRWPSGPSQWARCS